MDPSRNRLASTAYFAIVSSVFHTHGYVLTSEGMSSAHFLKRGQSYANFLTRGEHFYMGELFPVGGFMTREGRESILAWEEICIVRGLIYRGFIVEGDLS